MLLPIFHRAFVVFLTSATVAFWVALLPTGLFTGFAASTWMRSGAPSNAACRDARGDSAVFGVVWDDEAGGEVLEPAQYIPLIPGVQFGWILQTDDEESVLWREELITPSAPLSWSGEDFMLSSDRTRALSIRSEMPLADGTLSHVWMVEEGDPPGEYELRLWQGDRFVGSWTFELVEVR